MNRNLAILLAAVLSACAVQPAPRPLEGPGGPREDRRAERRDDRQDARFDANSPWDKLGELWVDGTSDRDAIAVTRGDRYTSVKLVVEHSAVELYDVVIVFGNGEPFSPGMRMVFGANTTSRTIDLPGNVRAIQRVEFRYGNLPGGGKAQVEVWGLGNRRT